MNRLTKEHFYLHTSSYPSRSLEVREHHRKYGGLKHSDDALVTLNPKPHKKPPGKFKTALPSGGTNGITAGCSPGNSSEVSTETE